MKCTIVLTTAVALLASTTNAEKCVYATVAPALHSLAKPIARCMTATDNSYNLMRPNVPPTPEQSAAICSKCQDFVKDVFALPPWPDCTLNLGGIDQTLTAYFEKMIGSCRNGPGGSATTVAPAPATEAPTPAPVPVTTTPAPVVTTVKPVATTTTTSPSSTATSSPSSTAGAPGANSTTPVATTTAPSVAATPTTTTSGSQGVAETGSQGNAATIGKPPSAALTSNSSTSVTTAPAPARTNPTSSATSVCAFAASTLVVATTFALVI